MLRTESEHRFLWRRPRRHGRFPPHFGMAVARDKTGGKEHVVAVAGDAAFTCGITYEALNNIAHHTRRMIVVLMIMSGPSIRTSAAIGQLSPRHRHQPRYDYLHDRAGKFVEWSAVRSLSKWRAKPKRPPRVCCGPASS